MIYFTEEDHGYHSLEPALHNMEWISGTKVVGHYKEPFDPKAAAEKATKNRRSKWYKISVPNILQAWKMESDRSLKLGNYYHKAEEIFLLSHQQLYRLCKDNTELLPVYAPLYNEQGHKLAPRQKLSPGVYPEHMIYLQSAGVCGQSDRVDVSATGEVDIIDYKTSKEIKLESYVNWQGTRSTMRGVLAHIDDCNYYHYALQLSLYLYIILRHNPQLKPGVLLLQHIIFEEHEYKDQYGYPIHILDQGGNPIVKEIVSYGLPYLEKEVKLMLAGVDQIRQKTNLAYA